MFKTCIIHSIISEQVYETDLFIEYIFIEPLLCDRQGAKDLRTEPTIQVYKR